MNMDIKPHEYIMKVMETMSVFDPDADTSWPSRTIRDLALAYNRVLARTYRDMPNEERQHLVKLMLFEA